MNDHTLPLTDVIPFSPDKGCNILILDGLTTEADFIVTALVRNILLSSLPSPPPPSHHHQKPQNSKQQSTISSANNSIAMETVQPRSAFSSRQNSRPKQQQQQQPHRQHQQQQHQHHRQQRRVYYVTGTATTSAHISSRLFQSSATKRGQTIFSTSPAVTTTTTTTAGVTAASHSRPTSTSPPTMPSNVFGSGGNGRLTVRCIPTELATSLSSITDNDKHDKQPQPPDSFDPESFLKRIYHDLKSWIRTQTTDDDIHNDSSFSSCSWIVLDDMNTISTLLGDKVTMCFVSSIMSLLKRWKVQDHIGLIVRCTNDPQQRLYYYSNHSNSSDDTNNNIVDRTATTTAGSSARSSGGGGRNNTTDGSIHNIPMFAGAGGSSYQQNVQIVDWTTPTIVPWYISSIEPSMDTIIDVLPLPSGFSRDAQGRIIISETPYGRRWNTITTTTTTTSTTNLTKTSIGGGSRSNSSSTSSGDINSIIVNYTITDAGPRAIRLRTK